MINSKEIAHEDLVGPCRFCEISDLERVIAFTNNFYIMLSLGAFVEGYLLIVTRSHKDCIADISLDAADEFCKIFEIVRDVQLEVYGCSVAYEHGQAGVCASFASETKHCHHAHLHMVPSSAKVSDSIEHKYECFKLEGWERLFSLYRESPSFYLLSSEDGYHITYAPVLNQVPRQFLRKIVAFHHKEENKWDWLAYPEWVKISKGDVRIRDKIRARLEKDNLLRFC